MHEDSWFNQTKEVCLPFWINEMDSIHYFLHGWLTVLIFQIKWNAVGGKKSHQGWLSQDVSLVLTVFQYNGGLTMSLNRITKHSSSQLMTQRLPEISLSSLLSQHMEHTWTQANTWGNHKAIDCLGVIFKMVIPMHQIVEQLKASLLSALRPRTELTLRGIRYRPSTDDKLWDRTKRAKCNKQFP